ncbi:MAG: hypothetical protein IT371_08155 [Deltaproteobacteria bacterium]|nr:hypothetical protein [Deltaproteobacteria bacterium]
MRSSRSRSLTLTALLCLALPSGHAMGARPEPPASKAASRALRLAGKYATRVVGNGHLGAFNLELTQGADGAYTVLFHQPHDRARRPLHFTSAGEFIDGPFARGNRPWKPTDAHGSNPMVSAAYQLVKAAKTLGTGEAKLNAIEQNGRFLVSIQYAGHTLLETFDAVVGRLDGRHATTSGTTSFEDAWRAPIRGTVQRVNDRSRLSKPVKRFAGSHEELLRVQLGSRQAYVAFDPSKADYGLNVRPADRRYRSQWVSGTFERMGPTGRYLIVSKELSSWDLAGAHDLKYREGSKPRRLYRVDLMTGGIQPEAHFDPTVALAEEQALEEYRKTHPVDHARWTADIEAFTRESNARHSRASARQWQGEDQRNRRADRGDAYIP